VGRVLNDPAGNPMSREASIIKMIDDTFGLPYQNGLVAGAYAFDGVNDFSAPAHALPRLPVRSVPPASMPYVVKEVLSKNDNNDS